MSQIIISGTAAATAQGKKSVKKVNELDSVLSYARKKYLSLPNVLRTTENKKQLITSGINLKNANDDAFYGQFINVVSMLLESTRFLSDCKEKSICPLNAAQHIAFSGKTYVFDVLQDCLDAALETLFLEEIKTPIFGYNDLIKYDGNHRLQDAMKYEKFITICKDGKFDECNSCPRHLELTEGKA